MSSRLLFPAAAAITALAVAGFTAAAPAASAATPHTTDQSAEAAAGWLAQQLVDGNHVVFAFDGKTFDGGGTADVIFALAAAKSGKNTIDAAAGYLGKHLDDYTSAGPAGKYDGSVGKAAVAAQAANADATSFGGQNLLQTLKDDECVSAEGSADDFANPYCPAAGSALNIYSSISEAFVLIAEARGAARYAPSAAAINYLLSLQCANGGFTVQATVDSGCTSDIDATAYAAMALQAVGGHQTQLDAAADYLVAKRKSSGAWVTNGGPNADSSGLAAAALGAAGRSTAKSRAWLESQQVTDGPTVGKGASRGALKYQGAFSPDNSLKATADGMFGLVDGASLATVDDGGASATAPVLALDTPTLAHHRVRAGGTQQVTGTGFAGGEKVRATLHSKATVVGAPTASKNGTVSLSFTVPAGLAAGEHQVVLVGATSGLQSSSSFTVAALAAPSQPNTPGSAAAPPGPVLADTGQDGGQIRGELLLGLGCVIAGGLALLLGRRRTHH